jgi:cysteine desulfurase/selenocysteine lyase
VGIATARQFFPGAERWIYMDVSMCGLLSTVVRSAVDEFLDNHVSGEWKKRDMLGMIEETRQLFADLVHADVDEIAFTKNVSDGLNMIAASLPWTRGDNVVFCPELEHPNNVYPWVNLEARLGVEIRTVSPRDGHVPGDEIAAAVDDRTRLVTVPTVSFSPGFITDLEPISKACRDRGAFFLVDAAQSVGVLETDVNRLGVDGLAVATQKGLLAFYGCGFLYCRRAWADQLHPAYLARFGVALGEDAHETAMDRETLQLADGARRFDLGNYNYLGVAAANASIRFLDGLGTRAVEQYVRELASRLAGGLLDLNLPVAGGAHGPHLAHIVAVGHSGGGRHYTADDPEMNSLHEHLIANGVRLSIRRGVLRFSLHVYNTADDVDRVLGLVQEWTARR